MTQPAPPPVPRPPASDPNLHGPPPSSSWQMLALLAAMLVGMWFWRASVEETTHPEVDYSTFYGWLESGKVQSVVVSGSQLDGTLKQAEKLAEGTTTTFHTILPAADEQLMPLLREKQVKIRVKTGQQPFAVELVLGLLPWALILGVWVWLGRRAQRMMGGAGGPLGSVLKSKSRKFEKTESVNVTFDDVAGLNSAKRDLQEVVQFLQEPEKFRHLGGKVPRGVLLVGPPGTGKTLLARAVAGESGVPFFSISASEFIEMFVGVGAARVRDLFAEAKKQAPAIIFIDEIDAVGRSRGAGLGGGHDEREQTLNQLLSEMDGFDRNDLTIVLAATNRPDVLDSALLRPGRFDRRVLVERPELKARRAILAVHTKNKPLDDSVDLDRIAEHTPGFSGADLANLVNEAALGATRRSANAIEASDFSAAYDKIVLGDPREGKLSADEKHRVAVHESGHAVVAQFVSDTEPLHRVTIIPRGMALGVTQQTPAEDRHLMTQPQLLSRLRVMMGGFAAERLVLGDVSTGAENDLKEATKLASKMVANYGMSETLGPSYYDHQAEHAFLGQKVATDGGTSDATIATIESEARKLLVQALQDATKLLKEHRADLERLRKALIEQETLEVDELRELFGGKAQKKAGGGAPLDPAALHGTTV